MKVWITHVGIFLLTISASIGQETMIVGDDPCSGKTWVWKDQLFQDTSQTYIEAVKDLYLHKERVPIEQFNFNGCHELEVNVSRNGSSDSLIISSGINVDSIRKEVYALFKISDFDFSHFNSRDEFKLYDLVVIDSLNLDYRDVVGNPQYPEGMPNSEIVQVGQRRNRLADFSGHYRYFPTVSSLRYQRHINPIVLNPELDLTLPTRPRAFLSSDSTMIALYIFGSPNREYQTREPLVRPPRYMIRILGFTRWQGSTNYFVVPPSLLVLYGFEYGGCFDKAYF